MGRYRPYDSDPNRESFNGRTGTHALGKRARKIDSEGVLIVRFELPFNVWCDACEAHIGQGVRYNAEKKQIGSYYSTAIFSFKCKKACCQTYMEIQTDPKHTRYIVVSGARQQNSQWDPEENGGFAIHDDEKNKSISATDTEDDPFAMLERKKTDQEKAKERSARLKELESSATRRSADPYTLNVSLRDHFRRGKKQRLQQQIKDDNLRKRIGWNDDRILATEEQTDTPQRESKRLYLQQKEGQERLKAERFLTSKDKREQSNLKSNNPSSFSGSASARLAVRLIENTKRNIDPFGQKTKR